MYIQRLANIFLNITAVHCRKTARWGYGWSSPYNNQAPLVFQICLISPLTHVIFQSYNFALKTSFHLEGTCSSPNTKLESGEKRYGIWKAPCRNLGVWGAEPRSSPDSKLEFRWALLIAGFQIGIQQGVLSMWKAHWQNLGIRGANYATMLH
jgi:hypothetical protein